MLRKFASQPPNIENERIAFLDGLRGLAVLAVVAFHTVKSIPAVSHSASLPSTFLQQLCHGVDLFFILSGFCLAYPTLKKMRTSAPVDFDVAGYWARRLVRIIPPYYAAIALFTGVLVFKGVNQMGGHAIPDVTLYDILRQAFFIDSNVRLLNISFWSLAVEFRWYFLFPVFLWLWVRSPRAFFAAGAVICLSALFTRAQSLDLLFLPTFMLGIVAAAAFVDKQRLKTWFLWLIAFSALAFLKSRNDGWDWSTNPLWGVAMFWLVIGAAQSRSIANVFSTPWLTKLGYASYGIYLTHEPVIRFLSSRFSFVTNGWALFGIFASIAVAFGLLFSFIAERPFTQGALRRELIRTLDGWFTRTLLEMEVRPGVALIAARNSNVESNAA